MHNKREWTFRLGTRLWKPEFPVVMGILNLTPDSFYAGSRTHLEEIVKRAGQFLEEGAAMLDVGAQSTRPGSKRIESDEEWSRMEKALIRLRKNFPEAVISVDTYHPEVAKRAIDCGASIINDIDGGMRKEMIELVSAYKVPIIVMHKQGTPETMQVEPFYEDVITDLLDYFIERLDTMKHAQVPDIILDPGFGFGKTLNHNLSLLNGLSVFRHLNRPLLIGLSRKKMVRDLAGVELDGSLNASSILNMVALTNGADMLRVHDVKEAVECVRIFCTLEQHACNE